MFSFQSIQNCLEKRNYFALNFYTQLSKYNSL
uniref:Uncharacterized protein n=1 Tax=Tetranychus urticae TaxID=32264 RepID=T1KFV6_TETUR